MSIDQHRSAPTIDAYPKWRRLVATMAGGLAVGATVVGCGPTEYHDSGDGLLTKAPTAEAPVTPGQKSAETKVNQAEVRLDPATTSPETFAKQFFETILSETVPILEEHRAASLASIDEYFDSMNQVSLPKPEEIENPTPENMAAQTIERSISADIRTITEISKTNRTLAENLARAVFKDPVTYQGFIDGFDGFKHNVRTSVVATSPELTDWGIGSVVHFDAPTLVLLDTKMDETIPGTTSSPIFNRILSKYTYDGDKSHYAVTYTIQSDSPNFIEYPENLRSPSQK